MGYNLLINGIYWGYNPLTNLLLTSWDIQVGERPPDFVEPNSEAFRIHGGEGWRCGWPFQMAQLTPWQTKRW